MEMLTRPWRHYFDFSGRSRRTEYFLFFICWYAAMFLAVMASVAIIGSGVEAAFASETMEIAPLIGAGLILLAGLIPGWAVTVRRLHDQDKSGWFILLSFIPYIGGIIMLVLAFLPGTDGPNQYGHDPRDPMQATADVFS